jgi:hypothetical protein
VSTQTSSYGYNGVGADAGSTAYPLQFSGQDDGGAGPTQDRTVVPGVGFVILNATDDNNSYVNFTLVGSHPIQSGTVCGD